jgi:endonuclease-3 related protein
MYGSKDSGRGRGRTVGGGPGEVSLLDLYRILFRSFGPQGWWPGETSFEVAVGAILTQNTKWMNVERAIVNLRKEGVLSPRKMAGISRKHLASLIRPAGCFNVKADRLRHFLRYLDVSHGMSMKHLAALPSIRLREELLDLKGIGPETADSILLYAAGHSSFVIDAYTRRIFSRHGFIEVGVTYDCLQDFIVHRIPVDAGLYNEFHALLVKLGKEYCRLRRPRCGECPLGPDSPGS